MDCCGRERLLYSKTFIYLTTKNIPNVSKNKIVKNMTNKTHYIHLIYDTNIYKGQTPRKIINMLKNDEMFIEQPPKVSIWTNRGAPTKKITTKVGDKINIHNVIKLDKSDLKGTTIKELKYDIETGNWFTDEPGKWQVYNATDKIRII